MTTIFLAGHGEWNIRENGFTKVPRGITVQFYTLNQKNMFTSDMLSIIEGTYTGTVADIYTEGMDVPNYTLHPDTVNEPTCRAKMKVRNDPDCGLLMVVPGQVSTLEKLMKIMRPGTTAVWCACRYNGLNDVGGKRLGVNGAQGTYGDRSAQGQLGKPGANPTERFYFNSTSSTPKIKNL
ncbi:MAG: putative adhesin [Acidobacteriota bacterium]